MSFEMVIKVIISFLFRERAEQNNQLVLSKQV